MSSLAAAVSSMLVHPGYFFPWRQMNTSLACQERALGKLVPAEALGRGLDMRRAMDLVCRGWKNNLTLAQPSDYILTAVNVKIFLELLLNILPPGKGWLYVCMLVSVLDICPYDEQVETSGYLHLLEVAENTTGPSLLVLICYPEY